MRKYRLVAKKGEGTFSEVLKAQNVKDNKYHAIKCMKNHFESIDQVNNLREIQALRRLSPHQHIVKLEEVLYDQPSGRLALVFELMDANLGAAHVDFNFPSEDGASIAKLIPHAPAAAVDLMHKMLSYDPSKRMNAREALRHDLKQRKGKEESPEDKLPLPSIQSSSSHPVPTDSMKSHESPSYDNPDELPPINSGAKMKPGKYAMGKQAASKNGQGTSVFGGGGTAMSLKPKSIVPAASGGGSGGGNGGNGSSTTRSGVFPTSVSTTSTKLLKKSGAAANMAQLPLKKVVHPGTTKPSRKRWLITRTKAQLAACGLEVNRLKLEIDGLSHKLQQASLSGDDEDAEGEGDDDDDDDDDDDASKTLRAAATITSSNNHTSGSERLRDAKQRYRERFERFQELKAEAAYLVKVRDQMLAQLTREFDSWKQQFVLRTCEREQQQVQELRA
ncbi:hypothetical protein PybrP1_003958 [[Pythium] brassicae (nom. inval.)]|nr:hypothetical protein PybrP1_003958 [[Pythium] brassicae (nom. inval.)]